MTLLLLAGTAEARQIAQGLSARKIHAIASLAGVTRSPDPLPLPVRVGGFGGQAGFEEFVRAQGITAVIDATHPFASAITDRTAKVCAALSIPYLQVLRPAWQPGIGDHWFDIATEQDAAAHIAKGSTVFLATGRQTLSRFSALEGCRVLCRQIDPPSAPFPFAGGEFIISRPPFSVEREVDLFTALGVDWLVVKNAGGTDGRTKLTAASRLGIPVLMLRRPPMPDVAQVASVAAALDWVAAL